MLPLYSESTVVKRERKALRTLQIYVMGEKLKDLDGLRDRTDS